MKKRDLEMADITAIYDLHARIGVARINETGDELMPQLILVQMGAEPGEISRLLMTNPTLINAMQRTGHTKDLLMTVIRHLLHSGDEAPDAVVHVSETWVVTGSKARDAQGLLNSHAEVKDHPNRTEAVMVHVHTVDRSYFGFCPIETDGGERRAVFKPLNPAGIVLGRLSMAPEDLVKH